MSPDLIWIDSPLGTLIPTGVSAGVNVAKWLYDDWRRRRHIDKERERLIQYLFGITSETQVVPGVDHYQYRGAANPHDRVAAYGLRDLFRSLTRLNSGSERPRAPHTFRL